MKKELILIFGNLIVLAGGALAQDSSGTFLPTEQMMNRYDFYNRQVISQPVSTISNYSKVEAGYMYVDGGFRPKQEAPVQRSMYFNTEGTKQVAGFKVSGSFSFSRDTKDSVAYTLQDGISGSTPYYFYSAFPGNWEINRYTLQGILSRQFFHNRFTVVAGAKYLATNAWRSNDPRTDQFDHSMKGDLGLLFKIHKNHTLGLNGGLLLDASENTNEYRNKDYQDNLQFIDRINFIQYGYGLTLIQTTNRSIISKAPGWNAGGLYQFTLPAAGRFTLKGGYSRKNAEYFRRPSSSDPMKFVYGQFKEWSIGWDGLWESDQYEKGQWTLSASYNRTKGSDFHMLLNGNNYVYHQEYFSLSPAYLHKKDGQPVYELWMIGRYRDHSRADGSTSHLARYKTLSADLGAAGYWRFRKAGVLKMMAGAGVTKNTSDELKVPPSQETDFSGAVVYHDYYYYTASVLNINGAITYYFPVKKTTAFAGFSFRQQSATLADKTVMATEYPGNRRILWQFNIGIGL